MDYRPLGDYEHLLVSRPHEWANGTVVHGSGVLDDLVAGIEKHISTSTDGYWSRLIPQPVGIGCVPWLTDDRVVDALMQLGQFCVLVDKQQPDYAAVRKLARHGNPLSGAYLPGFEELALPDANGAAPIITPHSGKLDPVQLGPVRVVGWQQAQGEKRPMLHSKLLVLGVTTHYEDDEMFAGDILKFHPKVTWMGSANWSANSRRHVEFGMWSSDPALVQHNFDYLLSLVTFSEPRGVATVGPEPELVSAVWDDDSFREYFAEHRDLYIDHDDVD
jgi:hypothetical protein